MSLVLLRKGSTPRRLGASAAAAVALLLFGAAPAEADILRGLQYLLAGVVELPRAALAGTFNGPPLIGTVFGLVNGALGTVSLVGRGALELAASGVAVAKTVGPYLIPIFL